MRRPLCAVAVSTLLLIPATTLAQQPAADASSSAPHEMTVIRQAALEWAPITPPGFEEGMQIAVVSGDPSAAAPYTLRLAFPDGYRFPPHWHPQDEHLTVLSGTFLLAVGEEEVDEPTRYGPGDYLTAPARQSHYGGAIGQTVVQLHGMGPFEVYLAGQEAPSPRVSR